MWEWRKKDSFSQRRRGKMREKIQFTVIVEKDEDGFFVATVPALRSCYTQARTLEELYPRIREVIELCLEEETV
jgi:predicted RNase H-like HicB family nuclease